MADIEKVIKGIEKCIAIPGMCRGCPYEKCDEVGRQLRDCSTDVLRDALELLKEQNGLAKALEQMIATNAYLNAEKERLKNLLEHREAEVAILSRSSIVRCKDCKTSVLTTRMNGMKIRNCPILCMDVDDDFYCGGAKPKDGDQE